MSVSMMAMSGQFSKDHCQLCAKICDKCAEEYAMFKDDHCQKCADICRIWYTATIRVKNSHKKFFCVERFF